METRLGVVVRNARHQIGMTQRELAARAGLDRALLSRVETGRDCRLSTLIRLAEALEARLTMTLEFRRPVEILREEHLERREQAFLRRDPGFRRGMRPRLSPQDIDSGSG